MTVVLSRCLSEQFLSGKALALMTTVTMRLNPSPRSAAPSRPSHLLTSVAEESAIGFWKRIRFEDYQNEATKGQEEQEISFVRCVVCLESCLRVALLTLTCSSSSSRYYLPPAVCFASPVCSVHFVLVELCFCPPVCYHRHRCYPALSAAVVL